jgi:probable rRNA maturation factor
VAARARTPRAVERPRNGWPAATRGAARRALCAVGRHAGVVDVALVDDAEIRRLNRTFRGVRRRTDVLAFPVEMPHGAGGLLGQLVISVETARRQSRRLGVPLGLELELLVTHGVLHLVGYDDRDPVEARLMHLREREVLASAHRRLPARLWKGLLHA